MVIFLFLFLPVLLHAASVNAASPRLSLTFEPPESEVYIGQETFFQISLMDRIGVKGIGIIPAKWPNADIFLLKRSFTEGVPDEKSRYNLHKVSFSLIPKSAGKMAFPPLCLSVSAPTMVSLRDLPDDVKVSSNGDIEICSPPFSLNVKELPPYSQPLFASSEVKLFDGIFPRSSSVPAGTPVKRSVFLSVKGTLPAFLPDFQMGTVKNGRSYSGKTERSSPPFKNGSVAALRQTVVIIPEREGTLVLPEIKVPWLNTQTGRIETAVIPAYPLIVTPALNGGKQEKEVSAKTVLPKRFEKRFVAVFVGAGVIGTALCFILFKFLKKKVKRKRTIKNIRIACEKNDFKAVEKLILAWAVETFPQETFHDLSDVRKKFEGWSDDFVNQLENLEMYLYGTGRFARYVPSVKESLGKGLSSAFFQAVQVKFVRSSKKKTKLPELYPDDTVF
ncbi:MAG: BatD family protein [Alphaproteobacteria bacterium]|nr:BatD family protein [Alphaproteobacteria bacterium]